MTMPTSNGPVSREASNGWNPLFSTYFLTSTTFSVLNGYAFSIPIAITDTKWDIQYWLVISSGTEQLFLLPIAIPNRYLLYDHLFFSYLLILSVFSIYFFFS